jgi:hypothetical protein
MRRAECQSRSKLDLLAIAAAALFALLLLSSPARAQGTGQGPTGRPADLENAGENAAGRAIDNYTVMQTVEIGGRITSVNGSEAMYGSLLNLQSGFRVFDQSLTVRPMAPLHAPIDNLYLESFGWGGDPSNAVRMRINKRGLYNFYFSFRRDQNNFNYDLLANPLNPTSTTALPTIFVPNSPHAMYTRRKMYDYDLTVFPQRAFSARFAYVRNSNQGPSFSSVHFGTEALLNQPWSTTLNEYRFGASWRALPQTTLTYTEALQFLKNDTDQNLATFNTIDAANGTPIEFGLPWLGGSPCGAPIVGGFANPSCNGYLSYTRTLRYRNYLPSEQINLNSSSIPHLDLTARFMYSNADANTPLAENFNGLETRTGLRQSNTNGTTAHSYWNSDEADFGATYHLGPRFRIVDSFRFYAYRVPGTMNLIQNNFFNLASVTAPTILGPVAVYPVPPYHNASSPPDVQNDLYLRFVQQSIKSNEFSLQYDINHWFGVRLGYLFRQIYDNHHWVSTAIGDLYYPDPTGTSTATCTGAGGTVGANGICTVTGVFDSENEPVTINQQWGIGGIWYRTKFVRADGEVRILSADNYLTRIDPLHEQQYRANLAVTPLSWLTLAANLNMREQRNPTQDFAYKAHVRNFGFNVVGTPNSRLTFDVAYNYTDTGQNANVCFASSAPPATAGTCVNDNTVYETLGFYSNHTHYASANVMFKPVPIVTIIAGYSVIDANGNTLILNALEPLGPLEFRYDQPLASVTVNLRKYLQFIGGWNYYQYNETSFTGPTAPRYFHANLTNLSLRYAF